MLEIKPKKGLGQLNWSCKGPLSILAFKILFKSIAVSKDWKMQVKRTADKEGCGRGL